MNRLSIRLLTVIISLIIVISLIYCDKSNQRDPYPPEHCAYYLTGEMDTQGLDADGDGVTNAYDVCPNNPAEWLDSDRDGIGNSYDNDMDGDGINNDEDTDCDGDGIEDTVEEQEGTNPFDPSSIPGLQTYVYDQGTLSQKKQWYKGDLHVHCEYSHDSTVPLEHWIKVAANIGLDFLALTDHRNVDHLFDEDWKSDKVLLLSGIEWGGPGHSNFFGLRTDNTCDYDNYDEVIQAFRKAYLQGALTSINHFCDDTDYWISVLTDKPEIKNYIALWETWNVWWLVNGTNNLVSIDYWEGLLNQENKFAAVGGSDVHYSSFPLGFPTTFVYADNLSNLAILKGLREGRTYIANAYPYFNGEEYNYDNIPQLDFTADGDGNGSYEAMIGDTLTLGSIQFKIVIQNAFGLIQVIKNGEVIKSWTEHTELSTVEYLFTDTAEDYSWYRVEMYAEETSESDLLLFSSPIYVE